MEGFWGILKRERYYGTRFTSKHALVQMIENHIHYYNTRRVQRNLGILTPMEKHVRLLAAQMQLSKTNSHIFKAFRICEYQENFFQLFLFLCPLDGGHLTRSVPL